ncbi:MAG: flagellar hook-length control protein FliK, partial [Planctomycetota bacterium]
VVVSGEGKSAAVGQEQITAEALAFAHSQQAAAMNGQRLAPLRQTNTTNDGEKPVQTGTSEAGSGQKIAVKLQEAAAVQEKSRHVGEDMPFGPVKNAFAFQKSAQGDVTNHQQTQATISQEAARWAPDKKDSKPHAEQSSAQTENTSGGAAPQKLNAAQIQTSSNQNQSKGQEGSTSNKNTSDSNLQHVMTQSNVQNVVLEQAGTSTQAAKGPTNPESGNVYTGVGEQIRESIHSLAGRGHQQITIRLNPPELGYVSIKLVEQGDEITGLLEVSRNQTRYEIQQVLPEVIRNLADSGVQIKRLDVMLADESAQQNYKDQSLQDGWGGRHNFPEGGSFENRTANEYMENGYSYQDIGETHQMFVTDNSINMLV